MTIYKAPYRGVRVNYLPLFHEIVLCALS